MNATIENTILKKENEAFLRRRHQHYINGEWVDGVSGERIDVLDPATGRVITTVSGGVAEDVNKAVAAARVAFESGEWRAVTGFQRGQLLHKLADRLEELGDEFAELEALDCGKPVTYARAVDISLTARVYAYQSGWASKIAGETLSPTVPGEYHAYTLREPIGVVGAITPWNFPMLLTAMKLAPLLAAGCTAVLKPSELTPLSTLRLIEVIEEVGFPRGVVNVVTGYGYLAGAALAEHEDVDKISFTGSGATGRRVLAAAGKNFKRVTLELGGKSPMIVFPDADLERAIPGLAAAIFFHQGQVCTAGSRLYVHKSIHDQVIEGIVEQTTKLKIGHGLDPSTTMGPMVSADQLEKVLRYVDDGRRGGAETITGGGRIGTDGFFMSPTVLVNTDDRMTVNREEIFGPVLCAQSFTNDDLSAVVASANDTDFGLAASGWSRDLSVAHKVAQKLRAGSVWINAHNILDPALPFGGFKQSGWGREQGSEAIRMFTEVKTVCAAL
jgi:phenylacetaldehyde dehydrogenase